MNYKERIAALLQQALGKGLTQTELARELGFNNPNLVSMHADPENTISPFPLKRIPALARHCELTDREALGLINARAIYHPTNPTELDQPTLTFMLRCGITSMAARRSKAGVSHAC